MSDAGRQRKPRLGWAPWFVLLCGIGATALVTAFAHWTARQQNQLRFENAVRDARLNILSRLEVYLALLRGGNGLFAGNQQVNRKEFRAFVDRLDIVRNYPGIQGIGFSVKVRPEEKMSFTKRIRSEGMPGFLIWPETPRAEYHSIAYLEPLDARNQAAIGYDMFSDLVRRAAMVQARDTGTAAASGKVTLVQEIDPVKQAGFLIYLPVYRGGETPDTVEARRESLVGFVYAPFRADDLFAGIFETKEPPRLSFEVYDTEQAIPETLLHATGRYPPNAPRREVAIEVAGRPWTIVFHGTRDLAASPLARLVPLTAAAGLIVALLLFATTLSQRRAQVAAEEAALELERAQEQLRQHAAELEGRVAERTRSLEESVRSLESFSYSIAHDLRAPLRTIHSFSDLLLQEHTDRLSATGRDYAARIVRAARRMDDLIQDLLAYGRLSREKLPSERVDLERAVSAVLDQLQDEIARRSAHINVAHPLPSVAANSSLLQQALANLVSNALKFVAPDIEPRVDILAQQENGHVRVVVKDNGIGIAPEQHHRIFGVFERLHSNDRYPGTGIGLAIVFKAAERMGGRVGVDSALGKGSAFWIELPAA